MFVYVCVTFWWSPGTNRLRIWRTPVSRSYTKFPVSISAQGTNANFSKTVTLYWWGHLNFIKKKILRSWKSLCKLLRVKSFLQLNSHELKKQRNPPNKALSQQLSLQELGNICNFFRATNMVFLLVDFFSPSWCKKFKIHLSWHLLATP